MTCYPARVMEAVILSIGSELTAGQHLDTNAAWLAAELTRLGVNVTGHQTVEDDIERIRKAVRRALDEADFVIATGGLGPTPDDRTRPALAQAIDEPLEENAEALAQIRGLFERWQRPMHDTNPVQAMIPKGCKVIPNERGTAPGIWYVGPGAELVSLPGVPEEMKEMFRARVAPVIESRTGQARTVAARLLSFGISEAKVGALLADLMSRERNPQVGTSASNAIISVRVMSRGRDASEAKNLLARDVAEIRRRLGRVVFGENDDSLEGVVGGQLTRQGRTVAVAESCTGGLLGKRLTDIPGSSGYFLRGYVVYSNQAKAELLGVPAELIAAKGAVSEPVARAMASGCRTAAGSDYALSITGIAGPSGGEPPEKPVGLVYVGLADSEGVETKRLLLGEHLSREDIRDRACSAGLNLLRLRLLQVDAS